MKLKTVLWIIGAVAILALIPIGILSYQNQKLKKENLSLTGTVDVTQKKLTDSLLRADTERTDELRKLRDLAKEQGSDIGKIERDLRSLGASLEAVAQTSAQTKTVVHNHYTSTSTTPSKTEVPTCPEDGRPIDVHGYTKRIETINLEDSNGMRVADVSFAAAEKTPWSSKIYGLRYKINNTIGRSQDGQIVLYTELLAENPEAQPGETFHIEGVESRVLQAPEPGPSFQWWDPALFLNAHLAIEVHPGLDFTAGLSLGFSIFSYGEDWRFLGITAGYDAFQNEFRASLIPALYNVGGPMPFLQDLWLGLDVSISHNADVGVGLVIGTTL